jgi:hypothetical protein
VSHKSDTNPNFKPLALAIPDANLTLTLTPSELWDLTSPRPFNYMDTFTPCIFLAYFGDMFFSLFIIWGHSVAASCFINLCNLCNLGAELSILRCKKRFRGVNYVERNFFFFFLIWGHFLGANLGSSCIPYTV